MKRSRKGLKRRYGHAAKHRPERVFIRIDGVIMRDGDRRTWTLKHAQTMVADLMKRGYSVAFEPVTPEDVDYHDPKRAGGR